MRRRLLSYVLSMAMLISLAPVFALPARAVGAVGYTRRNPEVAILNANTGGSSKFYEGLKSNDSKYNAISKFSMTYSKSYSTKQSVTFSGYGSSVYVRCPRRIRTWR